MKNIFKTKHILFLPVIVLLVIFGLRVEPVKSATTNYTVCDSGCDFTTLASALLDPGLDGDADIDTITLTSDYVFNYSNETTGGTLLNIPSGVTISCDSGADTFGDKTQAEIELSGSTNITIQSCITENIKVSLFGTNVNLLDNTFSSDTNSWITLTSVDGFEISGNTGIQRIQLQGADNGLIENNDIECRQDNNCLNVVTAGAPDYSDPPGDPLDDHICNNVLINNNRIINHIPTGNFGDWILVNSGKNIQFTNNTISSAVTLTDDPYLTAISVQNAQVEFKNNYFISPERTPGSTNATWAFNIRADQYHVDALYEHNTIYGYEDNLTCIGFWDGSNDPTLNIDITANYNICYNGKSTATDSAFNISYDSAPGNANVTFSDKFNGIYNYASPYISDQSGVITSLNSNTVTSDPLFRTENADTSDDLYPSPISRYYDVDGTKDIGAHSGSRINNYLIDDDCTVDYINCFSNTVSVLQHAISDGDFVNIAAGNYDPVVLDFPASGVTFSGAGSSTIFDAGGSGSAFYLENINNSDFSGFQAENSTSITTTTYSITRSQFTDGVTDYNQTAGMFGVDNVMLVLYGSSPAGCDALPIMADNTDDITSIVGDASVNWNMALVDVDVGAGSAKFTILSPSNILSAPSDAEICDPGMVVVDYFVEDVFTVSDGVFSYNSATILDAGLEVLPTDTDPPALTRTVVTEENAGLFIKNSSGNNFTDIISTDNNYGVWFNGTSSNNRIISSEITGNIDSDTKTDVTGDNSLQDSTFDISNLQIDSTGKLNIYYTVQATVQISDGSGSLEDATVTIKNANGTVQDVLITDINGLTPFSDPILATTIGNGDPLNITSGGWNPFSFDVSVSGFSDRTIVKNINTPFQNIIVSVSSPPSYSPPVEQEQQEEVQQPTSPISESEPISESISELTVNQLVGASYSYKLIGQSAYPSVLNPGEVVNVWIDIQNTGSVDWSNNVRLGSGSAYGSASQQRDYNSEFSNTGWRSSNRPTNLSAIPVKIGETGRFQFNIKAPATAGVYRAYFTPVADGVTWMKDIGIYWEIRVNGSAQPVSNVIGNIYIVKEGDTLCSIANQVYSTCNKWYDLVEKNASTYPTLWDNPGVIGIGWRLGY